MATASQPHEEMRPVTLRMPAWLHAQIVKAAHQEGMNLNEWMRRELERASQRQAA